MTQTSGPSAVARRADATSNAARIVAAARRVFTSGDGLGSLEEIAREAGVGIATLYRHFARREALASAVYTQLFDDELGPALERARQDPSPVHGLKAAAEALLAVLSRAHGLVASTANLAVLTGELLQRFAEPIDEIVVKAQKAGEIRTDIQTDDIPRLLVMIIAGLTVPGLSAGAQHRYLTLVFDGLSPQNATPLPPIGT
ncbi:TetR/AcrR family transcriptional regulator [Cellulomonas hominis]